MNGGFEFGRRREKQRLGRTMDVHRVFREFADATSMHGVPRIINARHLSARIFWSVICVCAFVMFLWQTAILLERYYSYPKKVNVEIIQKPVEFPWVSVCNTDHLDILVVEQLASLFYQTADDNGTEEDPDFKKFRESYDEFVATSNAFFSNYMYSVDVERVNLDMLQVYSRLGLTANMGHLATYGGVKLTDFIVKCTFMGETCNISQAFSTTFDPYYFNCFTFKPDNIISNRASRLIGPEYGLTMILFMGSAGQVTRAKDGDADVIPGMAASDTVASGRGAKVVVHSPYTPPYPSSLGYDTPAGFSVTLGVRVNENVRVGEPHGNCSHGRRNSSQKYTLMSCYNDCLQRRIINRCGCVDNKIMIQKPEDKLDLPYCLQLPPKELCPSNMAGMEEYLDDPNMVYQGYDMGEEAYPEGGMDYGQGGPNYGPGGPNYGPGGPNNGQGGPPGMPMMPERSEECQAAMDKWSDMVACRKSVYDNMTHSDSEHDPTCVCNPPCNDITYESSYSLANLPLKNEEHGTYFRFIFNEFLSNLHPKKKEILHRKYGENYAHSVSRVIVYIADNNVITTTEAPDYEGIRLISDIGGQLGLWIGISVMTLFEVLQLLVDVLRFLTASTRAHKVREPRRPARDRVADRQQPEMRYEIDHLTAV